VPTIVTQHLLGGFLIISLLGLCYANTYPREALSSYGHFVFAVLGIGIVLGQIFLGAWTSTHYAALSCSGFPFCQQSSVSMTFDWQHAFQWRTPIGINYEGGLLSEAARQTIQMVHRMGAMIVFLYWFLFFFMTRKQLTSQAMKNMSLILILLTAQIVLGIANAVFLLPLFIAVLHNMVAAALLLSTVWFTYQLYPQNKRLA
jgi:cytochrome c oxidase assembly protein subunit 15